MTQADGGSSQNNSVTAKPGHLKEQEVNTHDFWRLIDETHWLSCGDTKRQAKLLITKLAAQGPEAVLKFEERLSSFIVQANSRYDSQTSAFGRVGGFTDDGFTYFVLGVIAAGEEIYYTVIGAPSLVEIRYIQDKYGHGEQIGWVAQFAYYRATGQPHPDFDKGDYDEDDEYLLDDGAWAPPT